MKMISKQDILRALGGEETEDRFGTGIMIGLGIGALVGAGLAILLTPKRGVEMRETIVTGATNLADKARTTVGTWRGEKGTGETIT